MKRLGITISTIVLLIHTGCKRYIEVKAPYTSLNSQNVFSTDATSIATVNALYARIGVSDAGLSSGIQSLTYNLGLSADELSLTAGPVSALYTGLYRNELTAVAAPAHWNQLFQLIYLANSSLEGLAASTTLTPAIKRQLIGEAKFMRGYFYFYLTNIYGDVPLAVTTDYKLNSLMKRAAIKDVWNQIVSDLNEAKDALSSDFLNNDLLTSSTSTERVRPTRWAAVALLSRVYLYLGNWSEAERLASMVIANSAQFGLSSISNTFLKSVTLNKEILLSIQPVTTGWNTNDARIFILPSSGPGSRTPFYLNRRLVTSFEIGDLRRSSWIKGIKVSADSFYFPFKYKVGTLNAPVTEYNIILRLAELFLIRSEARAQLNDVLGSQADLNMIRARAGLPNTGANTKSTLLESIQEERLHEFFAEWGHRWLDLKRNGLVDQKMSIETPLKSGIWQQTDAFYPIPSDELLANPNLTQTPGY